MRPHRRRLKMSEIQRYAVLGKDGIKKIDHPNGEFVLYTDHLAEVAEKEEEIRKLIKLDHKKNLTTTALIEQIAALTAEVKEVDLLKRNILSQYKDVCFELGEAKARIKELESLNMKGGRVDDHV
jgi:hypothetical protein